MNSALLTIVLVINEIMAANLGTVMSPATNFDSWIELYNPTDQEITLDGMYLSDEPADPAKWKMPEGMGTVPAGGFKVVWLGSNNIKANHAPFSLNCDGGTVILSDAELQTVATATYPKAMSRTAFARTTDGADKWGWTATPTPEASNNTAKFASHRIEPPTLSEDSKIFTGTINVSVDIPEGAVLMYTTDGSVPMEPSGEEYDADTWKDWVVNGDCEGDDATSLVGKDGDGGGEFSTLFVDGAGYNGTRGMKIHAVRNPLYAWDTQLFVYTPGHVLKDGDKYRFRMKMRADKNARISVQSHTTPGNYIHWQMLAGGYNVTTQWQEIDYEGTVTAEQAGAGGLMTIAFNLNEQWEENNYYFDDISWESAKGNGNAGTSYRSKDGQFSFSKTTNLCCRLFKEGFLPSVPVTRSYIQTNNKYTIPVISIVGDQRYFSDPMWGINTQGSNGVPGNGREEPCNWNMDWDRPVNFSFITPDGEMAFNQDVNIAVSGGWTRAASPRSFKLKAAKQFDGQNHLDYQFFAEKPYIRNKAILVRNGGNDTWENNSSRFMDPALQTIVQRAGIDLDLQCYQPVIEYVNGQFRGVLNLREVNNKKFVEANHGYDDDLIDMFENFEFKVGDSKVLDQIFSLGARINDEGAYDELKQLLDIDEFTNYMAIQLYLGSNDWPHNNVKAYRSQKDGRYRFVFFDLDFAFKNSDPFKDFYDHRTNTSYSDAHYTDFCIFFVNLLENKEYRKKFVDTYCILAGSVFDPERVNAIVNELADRVRPMMQLDGWRSPDTSANKIKTELSSRFRKMVSCMRQFTPMKISGVSMRQVELSSDTEGVTILVNGIEVPYSEFSGTLFDPVVLEAKAPEGYVFRGWKRKTSNSYISTDNVIDLPKATSQSLVASFVKLSPDKRTEQGIPPVVINEVSATNNTFVNEYWQKNDWVELFNTTDEPVDVEGMFLSDNPDKPHKYQISKDNSQASTVIPPHGHLIVWCDKMDPLTQLHASFKLAAEGGEVLLTAADDAWSDCMTYTAHQPDETVGRYPDGAAEVFVMNVPTIAKNNISSSYLKPVDQPDLPTGINNVFDIADGNAGGISITPAVSQLLLNSSCSGPLQLNIVNLAGQNIKTATLVLSDGRATFSMAELHAGIYVAYATDALDHQAACKFTVR